MPTNEPLELPNQAQLVLTLIDELPRLRFAYVFGSAVRGELRSDSDFDIAIDAGHALDPVELLQLSGHIEALAERSVDLVDLHAAGPVLKMQVLQKGILLVCRDRRALADFQMYTPAQYEDWKHLSRPLEKAILERFQP